MRTQKKTLLEAVPGAPPSLFQQASTPVYSGPLEGNSKKREREREVEWWGDLVAMFEREREREVDLSIWP